MNLKKTRIIAVISTFIISFLVHFAYEILPNPLSAIIFPVNESVWEHMKILYTSIILYGIIDYIILKKNKIQFNNFILNILIQCICSIITYLVIFLPIYFKIGENMFLAISIMLLSYIISYTISYYILTMKEKQNNIIWITLIIIGYIIFGYLTYNPIHTQIFFDTQKEIYGIPKREQ